MSLNADERQQLIERLLSVESAFYMGSSGERTPIIDCFADSRGTCLNIWEQPRDFDGKEKQIEIFYYDSKRRREGFHWYSSSEIQGAISRMLASIPPQGEEERCELIARLTDRSMSFERSGDRITLSRAEGFFGESFKEYPISHIQDALPEAIEQLEGRWFVHDLQEQLEALGELTDDIHAEVKKQANLFIHIKVALASKVNEDTLRPTECRPENPYLLTDTHTRPIAPYPTEKVSEPKYHILPARLREQLDQGSDAVYGYCLLSK